MRSTLVLALLTGVVVSACSIGNDDPPKELKKTSSLPLEKIAGSYGAFSDGQKLELFVAFLGDGFLLLRDGDNVAVDVNGNAVTLSERIEEDKVHYIAEVASPPKEAVVTITFSRGADKVVGKVRVAPTFELKSPPATAKLGDKVSVDIDPHPDLTQWQGPLGPIIANAVEIHGDCVEKGGQKIPLGNAYPLEWDTSQVQLVAGSNGCELDVQVRLETSAPPYEGPKFGGGLFEGLQHRRFKLALTK
jgi:hypothetical protein